jgi:hypothetical protein
MSFYPNFSNAGAVIQEIWLPNFEYLARSARMTAKSWLEAPSLVELPIGAPIIRSETV